ncbi:hypothetical protein [Rhodopseudomonas sp. BAL398]|uniref:hypothetical protein n=1 Tax=Rhodopseudomonas sp. BAL398 TaxID=3034676 RepID=UPI0023E2C097|nr:hypothetical protein [Rhodopseudomonas sp. BAL398]MDF3808970.1 hypothetical protein [Rhodopseudomonas sp. BAL398]
MSNSHDETGTRLRNLAAPLSPSCGRDRPDEGRGGGAPAPRPGGGGPPRGGGGAGGGAPPRRGGGGGRAGRREDGASRSAMGQSRIALRRAPQAGEPAWHFAAILGLGTVLPGAGAMPLHRLIQAVSRPSPVPRPAN